MAQINIRVDDDVKAKAERVCSEIGISMSTAIVIYLKKLGRENKIPFELTGDPFYSESNQNALNESIRQMNEGKIIIKTIEELEKMEDE